MHRLTALALVLGAAACTMQPPPLHLIERPLPQGQWAWCLTPTGETSGWTTSASSDTETPYGTCAAPNRFVLVHVCRSGEIPADDEYVLRANRRPESEVQAMLAVRLRLSRDGSLLGDRFKGKPFCAPMPPS